MNPSALHSHPGLCSVTAKYYFMPIPIITNYIHQLSAMLTCRDGKGGKLCSRAPKMLYSPRYAGNIYLTNRFHVIMKYYEVRRLGEKPESQMGFEPTGTRFFSESTYFLIFHNIMLLFNFCVSRFHVAVHLSSNRWRQYVSICVKNEKVVNEAIA